MSSEISYVVSKGSGSLLKHWDGFTHPSADGASRCSCILATVSYDVMNTGGKMCLRREFSISLSNFRSGRAESYSCSTSSDLFRGSILPVLAVMLTCALPTTSVQGCFLSILPNPG